MKKPNYQIISKKYKIKFTNHTIYIITSWVDLMNMDSL